MAQSSVHKTAQKRRLAQAINLAGARYTPALNVSVSIATIFDGLGRTPRFYEALRRPAFDLLKHLRSVDLRAVEKINAPKHKKVTDRCRAVVSLVTSIPLTGVARIDYRKIRFSIQRARTAVTDCINAIEEIENRERAARTAMAAAPTPKRAYQDEPFRNERYHLYKINESLYALGTFLESKTAAAANNPRIILNGIAGSGKTHFLCDLAAHRIKQGLPTYIFLGEEFQGKQPWSTVVSLFGAADVEESFLRTIDEYAARKRTRALVIVDAVNEAKDRGTRWDDLNRCRRYKHIGFVLSVRSGFEDAELSPALRRACIDVEHEGFATHEWEALTTFFNAYRLPLPEVPLLFPEFRIPLFLKIFCEAFAGADKPLRGHYGFTHIFEQYVKRQGQAVLERLGERANQGESRRRIWDGVIKELALRMGDEGTDRVPEAEAITVAEVQFPNKGQATLEALEKAFLLTKVPRYEKMKLTGFEYRFPYQKFSDHLIVRNLLNKHLSPHIAFPEVAFRRGTKLGEILRGGWLNRGLIEALSIQVPQRLKGRDLVYVAPRRFRRDRIMNDAFLESLIWRDLSLTQGKPRFIRRRWVLRYLNKYIVPYGNGNEQILETILTVAALPDHPMNARLLHSHLGRHAMPQRDAFWIPFLNSRYGYESAVDRLIVWAWDGRSAAGLNDDSLHLAGIALAWCFASSNRFLRDRATKAFVAMLAGRARPLIAVLKSFESIDDPYISERLYAVAYGTASHPDATAVDVAMLVRYVYETIFRRRRPPVHILLRDYARGVIEVGLRRVPKLRTVIDVRRTRAPYRSSWPSRIPSLAYLKRRYHSKRKKSADEQAYDSIWWSLMHDNGGMIADFGNYVVNSTVSNWCDVRLPKDGHRVPTIREMAKQFADSLRPSQLRTWKKIDRLHRLLQAESVSLVLQRQDEDAAEPRVTKEQIDQWRKQQELDERAFVAKLPPPTQRLYRDGVVPSRDHARQGNDLDKAAIQRLIFSRVVKLGWRPELFARYDARVDDSGRDAHKAERIGKKYQWIAFHETLARIADNFCFRASWSDTIKPYHGPWQAWERDLDPTCLIRRTPAAPTGTKPWWLGADYQNWQPDIGHTGWARMRSDLPRQVDLLQIRARGGWLALDGFVRWEQPTTPGEDAVKFDKTRRDVWYIVRSYLIKRDDAQSIFAWAKRQDFMGRWMPDPMEMHNVFVREIPWSLAYQDEYGGRSEPRWSTVTDRENRSLKFTVLRTTEGYVWEGSGFDCSVDESIRFLVPARELMHGMRLRHGSPLGIFVNGKGAPTVIDPSVQEEGPDALLVRKKPFLEFLNKNDCELLWVVIGEKLLLGMGSGTSFLGRLEMGGAFKMGSNGKITGKTYTKWRPPHQG